MSGGGSDEGQEKSFDASETKIQKSREKGDVAQSTETNSFIVYIAFWLTVMLGGGYITKKVFSALNVLLAKPDYIGNQLLQKQNAQGIKESLFSSASGLFTILLVPFILLIVGVIVQRTLTFSPDKLKPKLSRISPLSNAKQKYGPDGMMEFLKRVAKLGFISVIAGLFFYQAFFKLPALSLLPAGLMMVEMQEVAVKLILYMILAAAVITGIDLPYVQFSHLKKLRMSFQELRDEAKESEGDPHMKAARRAKARAIVQANMMRDVATADVIIVNPTHYAVALKWSRDKGTVPICVAKGVDGVALQIRERAKAHDVPIHSDPPCARSLHALVEIGEPIEPEHYAAVAAAIHFADKLRKGSGV